ncbi:DUF5413 family protein [Bradyrhizobium cenepequi]
MKRFLIFAILGPPLGFITAFWGMLQLANWAAGHPLTIEARQILLLPMSYLVGLLPALLAAWIDDLLAKANVAYRIGYTALFAYALSYVPMFGALWMGFLQDPTIVLFGLIGAVPAAFCSWLATGRRVFTRPGIHLARKRF